MDADERAAASPPPSRGTRSRLALVALLSAVLAVGAAGAGVLALARPEVLRTWEQPASVTYDDGSTHLLAALDRGPDWTRLGTGRRHELYVGRDPSLRYGHRLDVGLPGGAEALEDATVEWTAEGVRLRLAGGHETFVPADAFTGGR